MRKVIINSQGKALLYNGQFLSVGNDYAYLTGNAPLSFQASAGPFGYLKQLGKCEQASTPTPSSPVDIKCNNGVIKYGWYDIITTSALSGYGTYVTPTSTAGTRAYKRLMDLPNGTYQFSVEGDYEIIIQWRDPADPVEYPITTVYENLTGWMTSGVVTLNKTSGGYGIAVRRTRGTDSITPSNFDGVIHVQERGLYMDGTPEVLSVGGKNLNAGTLEHIGYTSTGGTSSSTTFAGTLHKIRTRQGEKFTVSCGNITNGISGVFINTWLEDGSWNMRQAISATSGKLTYTVGANVKWINFTLYKTGGVDLNSDSWMQVEYGATATQYEPYVTPQTASVQDLFATGDYKDEQDIISGSVTRGVGIKVLDGTESVSASGAGWAIGIADKLRSKLTLFCTHYPYSSATMANAPDKSIVSFASQNIGIKDSSFTSTSDVTTWLAAQYAAGTPVIVIYPLATETTESVAWQSLNTLDGSNVISVTAEVSEVPLDIEYLEA